LLHVLSWGRKIVPTTTSGTVCFFIIPPLPKNWNTPLSRHVFCLLGAAALLVSVTGSVSHRGLKMVFFSALLLMLALVVVFAIPED